jgi:dimethylglycine dehydrogenase
MRIEKSYRMVGTELSIEYSAFESAMDRFICLDKGDFLGRDKLIEWQERGIENQLVTLEIDDIKDADVLGNNALTLNGELVGRATGGGFGFRVNRSLVKPNYAALGSEFSIDILGKFYQARVIADSPFDGKNERLRDVNGVNG